MLFPPQTQAHEYYAGYTEPELRPLVELLLQIVTAPRRYPAIFDKYCDEHYMSASLSVEEHLTDNKTTVAKAVSSES